jgi:hypothetical protein
MKKVILSLVASAAIATLPAIASAQPMTIQTVAPIWSYACAESGACGATTFNNIAFNNANPNDIRLSWPGTGFAGSPSQYGFARVGTPFNINVAGPTQFALGNFTHYNFVIPPGNTAAVLDYADLDVSFGILGANPTNFSETYRFDHWETPNNANPCPDAGANPCKDRVTFINTSSSRSFMFDGVSYNLRLAGFSQDGGTSLTDAFWSTEGNTNSATLYASIEVPEPSSLALTAAGFAMFVVIGNRRRNKLQA